MNIKKISGFIPGIVLAACVMLASGWLGAWLGVMVLRMQGIPESNPSPISAIMVAIVLGMIIANTVGSHALFAPGLEFSMKKLLRLGIILVGIKLSFLDVLKLGAYGIPIVFGIITLALLFTTWFAKKLQLSTRMGFLAAASTSICGVTATLAVAPTIDAQDQEVAYTITNVTLFGILAMFLYPYLAHWLFETHPASAGIFLGASIHETAQVMGAAFSYKEIFHDERAFQVATITKLTRNLFLIGVVPTLAYVYAKQQGGAGKKVQWLKLFPLFVLGFLAMAAFRSIGEGGISGESHMAFGVWNADSWKALTKTIGDVWGYYILGTAMAAVGLSTRLSKFKGLGLKPLYVGAASAIFVGVLALLFSAAFGSSL